MFKRIFEGGCEGIQPAKLSCKEVTEMMIATGTSHWQNLINTGFVWEKHAAVPLFFKITKKKGLKMMFDFLRILMVRRCINKTN